MMFNEHTALCLAHHRLRRLQEQARQEALVRAALQSAQQPALHQHLARTLRRFAAWLEPPRGPEGAPIQAR